MKARKLPSLTALRAFEAAARLMSFSRAADELNVTHSAVSRQIRELEIFIGRPLFHRSTRRVELTAAGARYAGVLHRSFDEMAAATQDAQERDRAAPLVISTMDSFAIKWLIPRLSRFQDAHPEIGVRIRTSDELVDFWRGDVDLAIRYGTGRYPRCVSTLLMGEEVIAICSPALFEGDHPLQTPDDLVHHRLLHNERHDWLRWLERAGATSVAANGGVTMAHSLLVIEAAIRGDGVGLTRRALVEDDLRAWRLVNPFGIGVQVSASYYIVTPKESAADARIKAFTAWARREAGQSVRSGAAFVPPA
ncbi:transcriptional regulator GcvA [Microvirga yunnanensis]|uniref:transcriptional regulator GcvA n=1 Tax=Microvirga yunnanensis TaxID=2953740 RepID=UPI0021C9A786|nr:transcriptional regulator GcvA [Microvirga sp. HBU65207]